MLIIILILGVFSVQEHKMAENWLNVHDKVDSRNIICNKWIGLDWIGLILFRLGHPLSHWLLFRGPSNQKYTINKQQTNKHTTLLIVISDKCSIMQCSVLWWL